jgi:uncharacterized membrane protein YhaH (DUF805 family)
VRRLHDTDHSAWWLLTFWAPFMGPFWFLYLMVVGGTPAPNRFGN